MCKFFSFTLYFLAISRDLNILLHVLQKVGEIICGNGNIGVWKGATKTNNFCENNSGEKKWQNAERYNKDLETFGNKEIQTKFGIL